MSILLIGVMLSRSSSPIITRYENLLSPNLRLKTHFLPWIDPHSVRLGKVVLQPGRPYPRYCMVNLSLQCHQQIGLIKSVKFAAL